MSEIKGLKELSKALKAFPQNVQNNILNSAVRAGIVTIQKEAKKNVPKRKRKLEKAIVIKKRRPKNKNQIKYQLGIKQGGEDDAYYGHIVEFGSSKMQAEPYMRPALESKADEVINEVRKKMSQRIDKEIERSKNA
ncbi:hypothetical protein CKA55_07495 [Arcobacter suis]|uniref:Phage protein, HK97 gp10 family n=1 Tax=Arcobacter suis CECT 7833 TaxID=663365 RepID=A0AAD0WQ17_9BACT|nr:HK97-gp10 family putative phage morphogenesis protein [Arcobacter suis]AXX89340.1 phage protein, HK97 gp10 family [Arcobacter suis CECT 7833]RWS46574.1 hypothetical protein CKA55_07495 [Arcobacter suis]